MKRWITARLNRVPRGRDFPRRALIAGLAALGILLLTERGTDYDGFEASAEVPSPAVRVAPPRFEIAPPRFEHPAYLHSRGRLAVDLAAIEVFRPSYPFWRHVFTIQDGSVAFGSAQDGRLLAVFPARGDWVRQARWEDPALAPLLEGQPLPARENERRQRIASLLEPTVGRVVHNATRGGFVLRNAPLYGGFLDEWGAIYERFGVPSEIGLAQAILESGLDPKIRSEARAIGFCQWLDGNWNRLKRLAPHVIEGYNQTTQAPYCAAYLGILATKYGSFIPALSEHHAGGTNVGRTLINGGRLGAGEVRERYFTGAAFNLDLRGLSLGRYQEIFRTYGPRSSLYAEMVFGNTFNVASLKASTPQAPIHAMRSPRAVALAEVARRTGLSDGEIRRYNPALVRQVPANANLYLPSHVEDFGPDVAFWRRPPSPGYASLLDEFVRMDRSFEEWDDPGFEFVLRDFERRFRETGTEEGGVMATVLAYVIDDTFRSRRGQILAEFRTSPRIETLFVEGVSELQSRAAPQTAAFEIE